MQGSNTVSSLSLAGHYGCTSDRAVPCCGSLTFWIMGLGVSRRRSFRTTVLPSSPLLSEG